MEKIPDTQRNETVPQPPADFLVNDPRFKELLQEASKDSLKSDTSGFMGRQGYSWTEKEGIVDKEGHEVFPSQLIGPAQIEGVTNAAKREFSDRYKKDFVVYEGREKTRVYESPSSDPAYLEIERQISKVTNQKSGASSGSIDNLDDKRRLRDREEELVSIAHWGGFVSEYPEKASAYASKNEYIAKAIAEEEERKQYWEGVEKSKQNKLEEDISKVGNFDELDEALDRAGSISGSQKVYNAREMRAMIAEVRYAMRSAVPSSPDGKLFAGDNPEILRNITRTYGLRDKVRELIEKERVDMERSKAEQQVVEEQETQQRIKEIVSSLNRSDTRVQPMKPDVVPGRPAVMEVGAESPVVEKTLEAKKPVIGFEKPKKVEESLSQEDIVSKYLAYQDMNVSADEKRSMMEYVMNPEQSGLKYAEALQEVLAINPKEQVEGTASRMVIEAKDILKKLGVPGSSYLESKTWAMWDIGKQYYYFTHPDEADKKYSIADPFKSPEKITEIIDRHVGWEAYRMKDKRFAEKFNKHPLYRKLQELLNKLPKSTNGDLSSKDLAELGSVIRKITVK